MKESTGSSVAGVRHLSGLIEVKSIPLSSVAKRKRKNLYSKNKLKSSFTLTKITLKKKQKKPTAIKIKSVSSLKTSKKKIKR